MRGGDGDTPGGVGIGIEDDHLHIKSYFILL